MKYLTLCSILLFSTVCLWADSADRFFAENRLPSADLVSYANFRGMKGFGLSSYFKTLIDMKLRDKFSRHPDHYRRVKKDISQFAVARICLLADLSADFSRSLNVWAFFRNFSSSICIVEFQTVEEAVRIRKILSEIVQNDNFSYYGEGTVLVMGHGKLLNFYRENMKKPAGNSDAMGFQGSDSFFSWTLSPEIQNKISSRIASKFAGTPLQDALSGFRGVQIRGQNSGGMKIALESNFQNEEQAFQFKVNIMEGFCLGIMKMYLMQVAQKQLELFKTMKVRQHDSKAVFSCVVRPDEVDLIVKAIRMVWENYRLQ